MMQDMPTVVKSFTAAFAEQDAHKMLDLLQSCDIMECVEAIVILSAVHNEVGVCLGIWAEYMEELQFPQEGKT